MLHTERHLDVPCRQEMYEGPAPCHWARSCLILCLELPALHFVADLAPI